MGTLTHALVITHKRRAPEVRAPSIAATALELDPRWKKFSRKIKLLREASKSTNLFLFVKTIH